MSQAKVDRYKEEKKNRAKIMKREKLENTLWKIGGSVLGLAIVAWIGFSGYQAINGTNEDSTQTTMESYTVNTNAIDDLLSGYEAN